MPEATLDFPILNDLREQGATDYVAIAPRFLRRTYQRYQLFRRQAGGFSALELAQL